MNLTLTLSGFNVAVDQRMLLSFLGMISVFGYSILNITTPMIPT